MEFVAFLEDLGDGICWVFIVCWESLDGHMVVMVNSPSAAISSIPSSFKHVPNSLAPSPILF